MMLDLQRFEFASARRAWPAAAWLALLLVSSAAASQEHPGAQVYQQKCAACHGPKGEGTPDGYPEPLVGDRSVAELAELITHTMPEGNPNECVGEEARRVAAYIYDAFYSKTAQARNKPPAIELSRLTVRQYENAVADLVGSFLPSAAWDHERGLRGEYFNSGRRIRDDKRVLERRDATVDFDFGTESPVPGKVETEEFAIRWEGAVLAADTGDYELLVETPNAARLWLNDPHRPLIDAWVKSGDQTEYRTSIRLLGGRVYPLRLEFFKSKKETSASVRLKWKRPGHASELIPERFLSPHRPAETLVLATPFPPDDRSVGYERGTAISREWDEATTHAAIETAGWMVARLDRLAGDRENSPDREKRLHEFCRKLAERAFRRPLSEDEQRLFINRQFDESPDLETAVKRVVLLVLKSPRFLYREVGFGPFDDYDAASWLSFGLWDSLPDQLLLDAAASGQLRTREQIAEQAQRMIADPRTRAKLRQFFQQWLVIDRLHELSKDAELFPGFDEQLASDLRTSLELFLDEVVWSERSDYRELLLADFVYVNGRLAQFYGIDLPADAPFEKVSLGAEQRSGVLTHPYLMSGLAYHATSSPIHRGVFVARSVLGRFLKPPPDAFTPLAPELHPDLTTRERVALQTSARSCRTCHGLINPLGFSLENFDAVGRYRTQERGKPIDASGSYRTRSGEVVELAGPRDLAAFAASSPEAHEAFVEQLFQYTVKQPIQAFGPDQLPHLRQSFAAGEFSVRHLLVELVTSSALTVREMQQ